MTKGRLLESNLFASGKAAAADSLNVSLTVTGASAVLSVTGRGGKVESRGMSVLDVQAFMTGYTVKMAERMRRA